jgi:uncharacterized ion transporter superfamily protein YfcC
MDDHRLRAVGLPDRHRERLRSVLDLGHPRYRSVFRYREGGRTIVFLVATLLVAASVLFVSGRDEQTAEAAPKAYAFALFAAAYSSVLGMFIPSGGSKWIVEAPYVLQAAIAHQVHLGWVVQIYNIAEALPNLINPFWMLPLLGILRLKARDLVGYSSLQLIANAPIVFFLCWLFARSLPFVPPMK